MEEKFSSHVEAIRTSLSATSTHPGTSIDDIPKSIKEINFVLDSTDCLVSSSGETLKQLSIDIINHPRVSVEAALSAGALHAKVTLVQLGDEDKFVEHFVQTVQTLVQDQSDHFLLVCLITGILNCGGPRAKRVLCRPTFLTFLLPHIKKSCSIPWTHSYQSFLALRTWSYRLLEVEEKSPFGATSQTVTSSIQFVMNHWENPLRGASDLVEQVLENVLDVCKLSDSEGYKNLIDNLWKSNMANVSWKSKSKYPPMSVLLPRIGPEKVMSEIPDFGRNLCQSLTSTHLGPAGIRVYRLSIKTLNLETWKSQFLSPLMEALVHDEAIIRMNALNHWVPFTIQRLKGSVDVLMSELRNRECDRTWVVKCLILKQERLIKVDNLSSDQLSMLNEALVHISPDVRIAAFSVLCNQRKKGDAPNDVELSMIREFVGDNLSVDSAAFRQEFLSDFTSLTIRCRNFCVANMRKKDPKKVDVVLNHLDGLVTSLLNNLFPGANYQRLITALEFLRVLSTCFFNYEPGGINKSSANSDPSAVLQYAQSELNILHFYTTANEKRFLTCVLHYMCDVRDIAGQLLAQFRPQVNSIVETLQKGFCLACSPKFGLCESGAILLNLCQNWVAKYSLDMKELLTKISFDSEANQSLFNEVYRQVLRRNQFTSLPEFLLDVYEALFSRMEMNFVDIARHSPMHGILTSLRVCLADSNPGQNFVTRLNQILMQSTKRMLGVLAGKRPNVETEEIQNASFADMGTAIEGLLHEDGGEDEFSYDNVSISDDHSLILACTWLNLKEVSLVAAAIVVQFGNRMAKEDIELAGKILTIILTRCRHKGVIEAASLAVGQFSSVLLADPQNPSQIPSTMLKSVLDSLEGEGGVSMTRRSAGLPMLIRSVVVSEARRGGHTRSLLSMVVTRLLYLASKGTSDSGDSEIEDSIHAHALHILKSLVHDAGLAQDIGLYMGDILKVCVENFNSHIWSIRNGSLQLFGALVPRLLGQKKVRSEDATHNTIMLRDFFARYSYMMDDLFNHLNLNAQITTCLVSPGLVPLLSLFCRVARGGVDTFTVDDVDLAEKFQSVFLRLLASPVINVRRLAAKAFANFTDRSKIVEEVDRLSALYNIPKQPTNFLHGVLCCITKCVNILRNECPQHFSENQDRLKTIVCQLRSVLPCPILKIQILSLRKEVGLQSCEDSGIVNQDQRFHPGFREWQAELRTDPGVALDDETRLEIESREDGHNFIRRIGGIEPTEVVGLVNRFLQTNLDSPLLNGVIVETLNRFLAERSSLIVNDPELALDLLDVPVHTRIVSGKLGLSARTSSLPLASACFSGMLRQPDFKMFFDGGGPYVAWFAEHCDALKNFSGPRNLETSRLDVANALIQLLPAMNERDVEKDFDLHVKYALCQTVNATFILLVDEDTDIRQMATQFVSRLTFSTEIEAFSFCNYKSLSTILAFKKLFVYALSNLSECAEWLSPTVELFYSPWNDSGALEALKVRKNRQQLFENGEGLNVYEEAIISNESYEETFRNWASGRLGAKPMTTIPFKLNLNLKSCLEPISTFRDHARKQSGPFSDLCTPQGYLMTVRCRNFLRLVHKYPDILYDKSGYDLENFEEMINSLYPHVFS